MKTKVLIAIVGFLFLGGLQGCKTMEAVNEDLTQALDSSPDVPSDRKQLVREVQMMLNEKGYDPGPADGIEGPATRSALRAFQSEKGLPVTAGVTKEAYIQLASEKDSSKSNNDARECVRNFKKQSGLINYRTTATLGGVSKAKAVQRLVRALGRKGFVINQNDSARGFVSGTFDAGKSGLQLSAFIEQRGGTSNVELNYVGTGASLGSLLVPSSAYQNELCQFVQAMQGSGSRQANPKRNESTSRVSEAGAKTKSETVADDAPSSSNVSELPSTNSSESSSANSSVKNFGKLVSNAELLDAADPFADVITKINRGARVRILKHEGDWVYVEYKNNTGFIYADRVR